MAGVHACRALANDLEAGPMHMARPQYPILYMGNPYWVLSAHAPSSDKWQEKRSSCPGRTVCASVAGQALWVLRDTTC